MATRRWRQEGEIHLTLSWNQKFFLQKFHCFVSCLCVYTSGQFEAESSAILFKACLIKRCLSQGTCCLAPPRHPEALFFCLWFLRRTKMVLVMSRGFFICTFLQSAYDQLAHLH